ncbi:MAG: hypothetical protein NZ937_08520 [Armatimonadetes bacterium]|nr:hypothetical protein [Armatimonadota bacterium]
MKAWFSPVPLSFGEQTEGIFLPQINAEGLSVIAKALKTSAKTLKEIPVTEIARKVEFVAKQWQKWDLPERKTALNLLPKLLPFSEPVCRQAIDNLMEQLTFSRLIVLLDEILGDHILLDNFSERASGIKRKAFGSNLAFLVLAGNIVGIGIWDIVFCLLCKTPVLVKPSTAEPVLASLFAQSFEKFAPELSKSVAVIPFEAERDDLIAVALEESDAVIAYGTDETVKAYKQRAGAKVRVIERGHKFSAAIVTAEFADDATAELLALDIARFDQRGCFSPQVCFLVSENKEEISEEFAKKVADAFKRLSKELPANLSEGEKVNVSHFRLTCQMMGAKVFASSDASWTVVLWGKEHRTWDTGQGTKDWEELAGWRKIFCQARAVHIVIAQTLDEVFEQLLPLGKFLQGVAVAANERTVESVAEILGQAGASRICPVGKLQVPPIEWSQDGKHLISELVHWCDLEPISLPSHDLAWVEIFCGDEFSGMQVRSELERLGIPYSLETDFDPIDPTRPVTVIRVPSQYAVEARKTIAKVEPNP